MTVDHWEEDGSDNSWEEEDLFAITASEIAEVPQLCNPEPSGLHRAFQNTLNSIRLFSFNALLKTVSIEEQSKALSQAKEAITGTSNQQTTEPSVAQNARSIVHQLTSDSTFTSNKVTLKNFGEYVALRNISSDDLLQSHGNSGIREPAKVLELGEYPKSVTAALHDLFHESSYLPCTCVGDRRSVCLSEAYICALRLDGYQYILGDDDHCFFDSVIAKKDDESQQWTPIQFRLPRKKVRVGLPIDPTDCENKLPAPKVLFTDLDDFCNIFKWNTRCFRVLVAESVLKNRCFGFRQETWFSNIFPEQGAPVLLSTALTQGDLSTRHQIFLAFAISKAFWQYYNSDWMKAEWSLETIQLLQTSSLESQAPFLKIKSARPKDSQYCEHEPETKSGEVPYLHRYPYILNLGHLLVQLGSITPGRTDITRTTTNLIGTKKNNDLCIFCCKEVSSDSAWPKIKLQDKHKPRYRRIVEECLPTQPGLPKPLLEEHLDTEGRRLALKDRVVRPLFELFQDMADPEEAARQLQKAAQPEKPRIPSADEGTQAASKTQGDLAWDWFEKITDSWLHSHVSTEIKNFKRPKIAIIDTGYDSGARFVDRKLKGRLNLLSAADKNCSWKDYWQSGAAPQDNDGHGTAMLSIVHRIAPFADICVARIASEHKDLKDCPEKTSKNLAKAILWAAEQDADIVSLSLGWEQEKCLHRDISNAIHTALSHRDQNLLIFAAASNLGGSKHELFPAKHRTVFSIRATNTSGKHEEFNPSLPERAEKVFGTLGLEVPASNRGKSSPQYTNRTGTSVATAITAGLAAIVVGYINIHDKKGLWDNVRMYEGFQDLLYNLSTEPEVRKRFLTLENHSKKEDQRTFETALSSASRSKDVGEGIA